MRARWQLRSNPRTTTFNSPVLAIGGEIARDGFALEDLMRFRFILTIHASGASDRLRLPELALRRSFRTKLCSFMSREDG